MVGWHQQLSKRTPGDSEGQGSLACCPSWRHKELDMTEQLNKNNKYPKAAGTSRWSSEDSEETCQSQEC